VLKSRISVHKRGLHVAYIDETNKTLLWLTAKHISILTEYFLERNIKWK